ncbi:MAG: hypothetical protein ACFFDN_10360 [Candidatus Hodarchaeota archaeon]
MSKEFADFMDKLREEPLEEQINEISDILTKVMAIVVSAIDDINQKMANLEYQFTNLQGAQTRIVQDLQQIKATGVTPGAKPIVSPATGPQAPIVKPAPKPAPRPLSPMSARSAINSELKALFSRRKK